MRFPEFSGEWDKCTLGSIGETFNGLTGKSAVDFGSGSPYITYKSIFDSSKIDISKVEYVKITDTERVKQTQNEVEYGDIFFTTSSETPEEVGMASVLLSEIRDCYLNSFCFGYRLFDKCIHQPDFFRFYLRSSNLRKKIAILAQGSTRFNISKNEVMKMPIFLPSLAEQRKISKLLSLIEDRNETQKKIIEKHESLIRGLCEKLTRQETANKAINECLECYSSTLQESSVLENGKYPVYGATGVCGYTDTPDFTGDGILIIKDGASVGVTSYAEGCYSAIGTLNRLTAKQDIHLRYVYYCIKVMNFSPYKTGLAIPHIYFKDYGNHKIWCPSYEQQSYIANILKRINDKIRVEKSLLEQLNSQKRYMLSQMFI